MTDNAKELLEDLKTLTNKVLLDLVAENEDLEERLKNKGDLISRQAVDDVIYDFSRTYALDYAKIMALINKIPSIENKGEWIPVTERLPKDGESVLFCDIDEDIMIGYHVKGRPISHFSQDGTYEDMKNVFAWMPLPEPYKAESEDKK